MQRLGGHVVVRDLLAGLPRDLGGVLLEAPRLVAAQLVHLVLVALAGEHGDGGRGEVGARGGGDAALAGTLRHGAVLQDGGEVLGVVLVVPAVAQERVRQAGVEDRLLGALVVGRQEEVRLRSAEDARVREQRHARLLRGPDHGGVLRDAPADLAAGDQQHLVARGEGALERLGRVVVGDAHLDALRGQVGGLPAVADDGHDLGGRDLLQQPVHDEAAQVPGGSGDDDAHGATPCGVVSCSL